MLLLDDVQIPIEKKTNQPKPNAAAAVVILMDLYQVSSQMASIHDT